MIERIVLVDFENVQPAAEDLQSLVAERHLLKIFHGPSQNSLPIKLVTTLLPLGAAVEFIQCEKAGKDALDFHLSFHLGRLTIQHPGAEFIIVSRDRKGFAQLIEHGTRLGYQLTLVPRLGASEDELLPAAPSAPKTGRSRRGRGSADAKAAQKPGAATGNNAAAPGRTPSRGTARTATPATPAGRGRRPARRSSEPVTDTTAAPVEALPPPAPAPALPPAPAPVATVVETVALDTPAPEAPAKAPARKRAPARKSAARQGDAPAVTAAVAPEAAPTSVPADPSAAATPATPASRKRTAKPAAAPAAEATPAAPPTPATRGRRKSPAAAAKPAEAPQPAAPAPATPTLRSTATDQDVVRAIDSLIKMAPDKRPVKASSLQHYLESHLRGQLNPDGAEHLLQTLIARGWVQRSAEGKLSYQLPFAA